MTSIPDHDDELLDQDAAAAALTYLASLAKACGVERLADLGDLPPFPELRRRVARGEFPPYE